MKQKFEFPDIDPNKLTEEQRKRQTDFLKILNDVNGSTDPVAQEIVGYMLQLAANGQNLFQLKFDYSQLEKSRDDWFVKVEALLNSVLKPGKAHWNPDEMAVRNKAAHQLKELEGEYEAIASAFSKQVTALFDDPGSVNKTNYFTITALYQLRGQPEEFKLKLEEGMALIEKEKAILAQLQKQLAALEANMQKQEKVYNLTLN